MVQRDNFESVNAWWSSPKSEVAQALTDTFKSLTNWTPGATNGRQMQAERNLAAFVGCTPAELTRDAFQGIFPPPSPTNVIRRIVDTCTAKIFSKQKPKAQVTTSGADYRTRITAREQSKFLLANLYQPQDGWSDSWELLEQVGKDALIWGTGVVKVYADTDCGKIVHERVYPNDLFVDDLDGEYGAPKNIFHRYSYDRYVLAAMFPHAREVILNSESIPGWSWADAVVNRHDRCLVYEGWRLPISKKVPGRHVICVADRAGKTAVLVDEKWTRPRFPFAFFRYKRAPIGFWGTSLIDEIISAQEQLDDVHEDLSKNVKATSGGYVLVSANALINHDQLKSDERLKVFELGEGGMPPQLVMPAPFNDATFNWLQALKQLPYELSGVSELQSQGRKETGIEAGVALRTMNDLQSELFLPQARNYERLVCDIARLDLDAANEIVDSGEDIALVLPNEGFLKKIDWKTIRFPGDQYEVQIQPSNSLDDSPAGRKQRIMELANSGALPAQMIDSLLDSTALDVEAATGTQRAQAEYIERILASYQTFDEDEDDEAGIRLSPDPLLNLETAKLQMVQGYVEMLSMDAPEANLSLVRDYIEEIDTMTAPAAQPAPALGAAPGGPAAGAPSPMPMAPPPGPAPAPMMQ